MLLLVADDLISAFAAGDDALARNLCSMEGQAHFLLQVIVDIRHECPLHSMPTASMQESGPGYAVMIRREIF